MSQNNSAKKRERQNITHRMRNRAVKSEVRTAIKKFEKCILAEDKAAAELAMKESFKLLDSATSKGILHRNTSSRKKSRLYAALAKLN
ncbi:MAG: 30S ribosomal protein S20 [Spirochaetia bacterium]|nr:30S ribosomal protein S20 [Spirochaetia bacterium]